MAKAGFISELRRRHVVRVALAYVVVSWLLLQLGSIVFPTLHAPGWCESVLLAFLVLGFPVALLLAWAFESTPEGVRRTVPADSDAARPEATGRRLGRKIDFIIIAVLVAAVGVLLWRQVGVRPKPQAAHVAVAATVGAPALAAAPAQGTVIPARSIAVLPFENLSADKNNIYFAAGMQDLILTKLADIGGLKVISRTSTQDYPSHPQDLKSIARALGVATLLEGSVQKAGNRVLVNVQLIDARTDAHIWAQSYTRTLDNVFSVEGEVAGEIAHALKAKLSPAETKRLATALSGDPAANDLYLRGEYFTDRGKINYDTAAWKRAIRYYRQAIAKVPGFAQARARLSFTESALGWFGGGGSKVGTLFADARAQAEQALKLAPDLADAHIALGYYYYMGKRDYPAALKAFSAALALRPNDSNALAGRAYVLRREGRFDAAAGAFRKALALDPRNSGPAQEIGGTYMGASRYAEAGKAFQHALALDPTDVPARIEYADAILLRNGNLTRALAEAQGNNPGVQEERVSLLKDARKYSQALTLLQSIPDTPDNFGARQGPKAIYLADLYRLAGNHKRARTLYAKALPEARPQFAALSGRPIDQAFALDSIAWAELHLGRTAVGLADAAKVWAIAEHSDDSIRGPALMELAATLYAQAGRTDKAVQRLSAALNAPGIGFSYSPVMLWLDPAWDPIRKKPAFQALLKKYARYRPATVPEAPNE